MIRLEVVSVWGGWGGGYISNLEYRNAFHSCTKSDTNLVSDLIFKI